MTRAWVGLDLGTTGVRVLIVDDDGRVLGEGVSPLSGHRDGVRHEQDPEDWWSATADAIRAALDDTGGHVAQIAGLAVDSTSGTFALLDDAGRPTSPGLMYDDARAGAGTDGRDRLERVNGAGAAAWASAGYRRMQPSWALPTLLWWLEHYHVAPGTRLVHQSDLIGERLVGHPVATDTSTALKTGANLHDVTWPADVLEGLGVPGDLLPDLVLPGTVLGHVDGGASRRTGLPVGVPVIAGMTDGCAAQLGAGVVEPGDVNVVLGTTLVVKAVATAPVDDPAGVVYSHRSPTGHWLPGGASSVGAGAVTRDLAPAAVERLTLESVDRLPTPLLRYPLVSPGERFPFVAADAVELSIGTPRDAAETFAAGIQGVAYAERLCLDRLDLMAVPLSGRLRATGGASANRVWTQLRADILRRPIEVPRDARPALGMAALAASSVDAVPLTDVVHRMVRLAHISDPAALDPRHDEGYLRLVAALENHGWLDAAVARHARERTASWA